MPRAEFVQMMAMELRKSKPIREQDLVYACELIDRDKNGRISLQVCNAVVLMFAASLF